MSNEFYVKVTVEDMTPDEDGEVYFTITDGRRIEGGPCVGYAALHALIPAERVIIETTEPKGVGAVAVDETGDAWVRFGDARWYGLFGTALTWDELRSDRGPLTVASEGVELV